MRGVYVWKSLIRGAEGLDEFEMRFAAFSAKKWKELNGTPILYTDKTTLDFLEKKGFAKYWDIIDVETVDTVLETVSSQGWGAVKSLIYAKQTEPFCGIDMDLAVMENVTDMIMSSDFKVFAIHPELYAKPESFLYNHELFSYYRPTMEKVFNYRSSDSTGFYWPRDRLIREDLVVSVPCDLFPNVAFIVFKDLSIITEWRKFFDAYFTAKRKFARAFGDGGDGFSVLLPMPEPPFIEQFSLGLTLRYLNVEPFYFLMSNPFSFNNQNTFFHTWGQKKTGKIEELINSLNEYDRSEIFSL